MFYGAEVFNQDVNSMDTSKVTSMKKMFWSAVKFDKPILLNLRSLRVPFDVKNDIQVPQMSKC